MQDNEKVTYFAETDFRNKKTPFGIKAKDRTRHVYVIGKTGMGKSTMLENMAVQDIQNGEGLTFVDPHGSTAEKLLEYIPTERLDDVLYFAPFDTDNPVSFNIMEDVGYDKRHLVASGLMSAFKKIWLDAWSARMEYILGNVLLALLEYPEATLLGVNRMLIDKDYRKAVVDNITDPSVKSFWVDEFAKYSDRYTQDATPAIQNKVGQFTSNPLIRNIVGQPKSSFNLREMMDNRKIIIVNLSKGRLGEGNANLLGSMLITKIYLSAMSRADLPEQELNKLPNFYFYVDEFQSFANESFADILSEARKYKLNLTMAHQYIEQMSEEVRDAVFGNVGTMIMFRVGAFDAEVLEKEFAPVFTAEDMVNLGFTQIYMKLMIDGVSSHPFSATTLPPIPVKEQSIKEKVKEHSRKLFSQPRDVVEASINKWYEPILVPKKVSSTERKNTEYKPEYQKVASSERKSFDTKPIFNKPIKSDSANAVSKPIVKKELHSITSRDGVATERKEFPKRENQSFKREESKGYPRRSPQVKTVEKTFRTQRSFGTNIEDGISDDGYTKLSEVKANDRRGNLDNQNNSRTASLSELKKPEIKDNHLQKHAPSEEHKNELKNALAGILKERKTVEIPGNNVPTPQRQIFTPKEQAQKPAQIPQSPQTSQAPQISQATEVQKENSNQTAKKTKPEEIPEDVLKNMLKVDE